MTQLSVRLSLPRLLYTHPLNSQELSRFFLLSLQNGHERVRILLVLIPIRHKFLYNALRFSLKLLHHNFLQYEKLLIGLEGLLLFHRLMCVFLGLKPPRFYVFHQLLRY